MCAQISQPLHPEFSSPIEVLPWDTEFFGFPVARLITTGLGTPLLETLLDEVQKTGIRLLCLVVAPSETSVATVVRRAGAYLVDRKVSFRMPIPNSKETLGPHPSIRPTTQLTPPLESLAWQSGEYSRFRRDPNFAPQVFQQLYGQWLRKSLTGEMARQVLVYYADDGQEQGLLTLGEKNGQADIGLLAVAPAARNAGIGRALLAAVANQARAWGYIELQVVTQRDNEPACQFYQKCGFLLEQEEHIYHLWMT